jgi:hypothetical protein
VGESAGVAVTPGDGAVEQADSANMDMTHMPTKVFFMLAISYRKL